MRNLLWLMTVALVACKSAPPPSVPPRPALDQAKFEPLYRAGKAVEGSLAVGMNALRMSELEQALSTEIAVANDRAKTEHEKDLVLAYTAALVVLHDATTFWKESQVKKDEYASATRAAGGETGEIVGQ